MNVKIIDATGEAANPSIYMSCPAGDKQFTLGTVQHYYNNKLKQDDPIVKFEPSGRFVHVSTLFSKGLSLVDPDTGAAVKI